MIKKILNALFRVLLIAVFVIPHILYPVAFVQAKSDSEKTIRELRQDLAALETKKRETENKKALTQGEINSTKKNIQKTEIDKENTRDQITKTEKEIEETEKEIERLKTEINDLLRFMQVTDNQNLLLEYIASAETTTDLIITMAVTEQITEHNNSQLKEAEDLIEKNEKLKKDLANKTVELEKNITKYNQYADKLGDELSSISDINADLGTQIKSLRDTIAFFKSVCKTEDQKTSTCNTGVGYAKGWLKPLKKGRVNSLYGNRGGGFHKGIDLGGVPEGTPIYATAMGRVSAIWRRTSCGGNAVFINHNVNGKSYTTNYSHLLSINSNLKVGTNVTVNTQIGTLGGSSTKSYDKCTTGAHLHYQVNTGHYMGSGKDAYIKWSTYANTHIKPPGFPASKGIWWYSR